MTPTEKHREAARALLADLFGDAIIEKPSLQIVAEHIAKAEREGMKRAAQELVDAWEELPDGDHDIDAANAWFANSLFPVLERFKAILSEAGKDE